MRYQVDADGACTWFSRNISDQFKLIGAQFFHNCYSPLSVRNKCHLELRIEHKAISTAGGIPCDGFSVCCIHYYNRFAIAASDEQSVGLAVHIQAGRRAAAVEFITGK